MIVLSALALLASAPAAVPPRHRARPPATAPRSPSPAAATPPRPASAVLAATPAVRAHTNLATVVGLEDYPPEALFNGEEGTVAFRAGVDAAGHVTSCQVTGSSGASSLDETTCRLVIERAVFTPARDAQGRATADSTTARVTWRISAELLAQAMTDDGGAGRPAERARPIAMLPALVTAADYREAQAAPPRPGTTAFQLTIGTDGRVSECSVLAPSGSSAADALACRIMRARARFSPARDEYGNPRPDRYQGHVAWGTPPA